MIARLERDWRRQRLVDWLIYGVPAATILASFAAVWQFGFDPLWVQILFWTGHALLWLYFVAIFLLGARRRNFLNEYYFGPWSEPTEEEKARSAQRDREQKELERLTRPVSWSFFVSFFAAMIIVDQWRQSKIEMTLEVGIVLTLLGTIAVLGFWGNYRIAKFYHSRKMTD